MAYTLPKLEIVSQLHLINIQNSCSLKVFVPFKGWPEMIKVFASQVIGIELLIFFYIMQLTNMSLKCMIIVYTIEPL